MNNFKFKDEIDIEYKDIKYLLYYDQKEEHVELYNNGDFVDNIIVFTDRENEDKEYICINSEVVYLKELKCLNV